jgi:hypothetical protein
MRNRGRIVLAVVAFAMVCGLAVWTLMDHHLSPPNLVYDGHPLSYWVRYVPLVTAGPTLELFPRSIDSNAVPYLVQALKIRDGAFRRAYIRLWPHLPGWLQNYSTNPKYANAWRVKADCCAYLRILGKKARPAIPELICLLKQDDDELIRAWAAQALGVIGNPDDKAVIEALTMVAADKVSLAGQYSARALKQLDPEAALQ